MNTIIAYSTKYGCTEKCVMLLSKKLTGIVELYNLGDKKDIDLSQYDKVIIGGSIYAGKIRKEVSEFCSKNINALKEKKIGLFVCGMLIEKADIELNDSFPQELLSNATAKDFFGGEFIFKKMNLIDRLIVNKVTKINKDTLSILEDKITGFAYLMNGV